MDAMDVFIHLALDPRRGRAFVDMFRAFEAEIGRDGAVNGLIETVLKLTLPGVPDIYQGAELWAQNMVDPDNRRPVDFNQRAELLRGSAENSLAELLVHWRDGAVKQAVITRLLALRAAHPALFAAGSYEPLHLDKAAPDRLCAFLRRRGDAMLLVAVRLYPWRGAGEPRHEWLPGELRYRVWMDALAGAPSAGDFLHPLPFSVLISGTIPGGDPP